MDEYATKEEMKAFFDVMFYFAISLRKEVEYKKKLKNQNNAVKEYFENMNETIEELVEKHILNFVPE